MMSAAAGSEPARDPARLRASDQDREQVAQALHRAVGEGRLTVGEVDERLAQVYAARTLGDLAPMVADLPGHAGIIEALHRNSAVPTTGAASSVGRIGGTATSRHAVAVMSGAVRKGPWVVPELFHATTIMGGIELDLTESRFATREVTIQIFALMGGVEITVPESVAVDVRGFALMGGFENSAHGDASTGGPVVHVTGFSLMGGVDVRRSSSRRRKWR